MMKSIFTFVTCIASLWVATSAQAQGRTLTRLFWQDDSNATMHWGDLKKNSEGYHLVANSIEGFPKVDADEQSLVQMQHGDGLVIVGVHDHADGTIGSGWVAIESGVIEEPHGDHSHWKFKSPPSVTFSKIDQTEGNPAHVYQYGKSFVMANDKKNGFTVTSTNSIRKAKSPDEAAAFFEGGNGHITLALVEDRVAYSTWITPAGEDAGRVDVVGLGANVGRQYSIQCPTGLLHGATVNSGKVFLAPSDGVCWVDADMEMIADPETIQVNYLSLGQDADDKPLRTGAFSNLGNHVLFTAGKGEQSKLCIINASQKMPTIDELDLNVASGSSAMTPFSIKTATGDSLACVFVESEEEPETDTLVVVALDPNRDGDLTDAIIQTTVSVGRNQINGHSGHHEAVLLSGGRRIAITNPGDQSIWILSATDFSVQAKLPLSGTPTRLLAIGG